jgi:DNA modification methylase
MARRQALSQRGGRITQTGDPEWSAHLAAALTAADGGATDDLTHGFHAYPARMHPVLARELMVRLTQPGQIVLDPFAGSGTVLIEAMIAGCRAQGVDLSPLASRIAEQQCALRDATSRKRFAAVLKRVAAASEARVRSREPVDVPIARSERTYYDPHVMLELSGLWAEIQQLAAAEDRRALELVFSSLLIKFSRQRADTAEEKTTKRIRKGLVTEFFARKGYELGLRWEALWEAAPRQTFEPRFQLGDARKLPELLPARFRADFVLTSPPYGGTYDYVDHHARRSAWLKLDLRELRAAEIGARRNVGAVRDTRASRAKEAEREKAAERSGREPKPQRSTDPLARWERELGQVIDAMRAVLSSDGAIVMWLGDAELAGARVNADEHLAKLAPRADLDLIATAAQEREDMRGGPPRREHLLLLAPRH